MYCVLVLSFNIVLKAPSNTLGTKQRTTSGHMVVRRIHYKWLEGDKGDSQSLSMTIGTIETP
jgi:hypothetical protein